MWITTTNPDQPLTEQATYVWNRTARDQPVTEAERASRVAATVTVVLDEHLPWIEPIDLNPDEEAGTHVEEAAELRDAMTAYGQCDSVVTAICQALDPHGLHGETDLQDVASVVPVQALAVARPGGCHFHDAVLVTMKDGSVFVVDHTFSQFDQAVPWPLVASPADWEARVVAAAAVPSLGDLWVEQHVTAAFVA
ncbi:hypothetical protein GCM10025867_46020 (plasmid) [Frondihabitans sucicola]|uniref:Uncharacterized protein n=1 Tax=Frondihabitans sucicola TaxID=1268041 RepID=A0ABM8GVG0_9MICO|nr:hypothetical protein [Frondihabitans sucicola]BDZ52361.1 hypothetical protein GCM10025867_46020 [Frondihabitans sucicola]